MLTPAVLAAGCSLGPDYERPWTAAGEGETFVHATEEVAPLDPGSVDPWWTSFGDPATAELVSAALDANTDLKAAAARVLAARAGVRQAGASRSPEIGAGISGTRQKNSFVLPGLGRVSPLATTYADNVNVAYQVDLFGGLSRTRQAAWAELLAQQALRDSLTHTVISEVVRSRVRLSTLTRARDIARGIRDSWADTLATTERRYESGLVSTVALRLARENLASAEAGVVERERELELARLGLDVLLGRRPGTAEVPAAGLAPLPRLAPVPLGLPVDLLERRPDVRAAEMRLAAATARVGVALADLFPRLTLTGTAGTTSDTLDDLLSSESIVYNVVANLVGPLFDGGRRRGAVDAARAGADEAAAGYAGAVLGALREVESALLRETSLREQLAFLDERVEEARAADRIARTRYGRGVEELLDVLVTERRLRSAEEALIVARSSLWDARIDLHLALGGDWTPEVADGEGGEVAARVSDRSEESPEDSR